MKIFVIAGHGAGDPGAVANGYQEAERVRVLAKKIKELGGENVILGDVNRNYYADKGISNLTLSKDTQILELHMDSGTSSARGGHVIINAQYNPDKYDNALADFISSVLSGRSEKIVKRSNLANCNRAATKGYSYRLLECGFISNVDDLTYFNNHIDDLAKGILKCFDVEVNTNDQPKEEVKPTPQPQPEPTPQPQPEPTPQKEEITVDGKWGKDTTKLAQKVFGTPVDGIVSNQYLKYRDSNKGLLTSTFDFKEKPSANGSALIKALQKWCGATVDGFVGTNTIKAMQQKLGTPVDGIVSNPSAMVKAFQEYLNSKS